MGHVSVLAFVSGEEGWCHVLKCDWYLTYLFGFLQAILGIQDVHNSFLCFIYASRNIAVLPQIQLCVFQPSILEKIWVVNSNIIANSINWGLIIVLMCEIRSGFIGLSCTFAYCVVILVCIHIWLVKDPKLQYCKHTRFTLLLQFVLLGSCRKFKCMLKCLLHQVRIYLTSNALVRHF